MKTERKEQPSQPKKKPIVLFPKGETNLANVLKFDFDKINKSKNFVIGRYCLNPVDTDRFRDFLKNIEPYIKKNLGIIPGIRTAFIRPKDGDLEFAVAIDYDKSSSFFNSAQDMKWRNESILSMEQIRMLMRAHIQRAGVIL